MAVQKHLEEEAVEYFKKIADNVENIRSIHQFVTDTIDHALQTKDYEQLFPLIEYIESGEGSLGYYFSGKLHRLLRFLHIVQLEYKYDRPLFCDDCHDIESVYDKYISCLFAMRRLTFRLSPESVEEAITFLRTKALSPFAVYIITSHDHLDRIDATEAFYMQILDLYSDIWSQTEIQLFNTFINTGDHAK